MAGNNSASNLIVNYLPQNMTDGELYTMFVTIGPVQSCRVMKDFKTNYSFGFGFVNYTRPEDAERAIQQLNGTEIFNKRIKVSYARPSGDDIKDTNLYVTNLPRNITEEDLQAMFEPFGKIVQKNLLLDKNTRLPRGVAFVRYNLREEAQEAIRNLDGIVPEGGIDRLSVRVAEEHGKQKAAYYAGWQAGLQQSRDSLTYVVKIQLTNRYPDLKPEILTLILNEYDLALMNYTFPNQVPMLSCIQNKNHRNDFVPHSPPPYSGPSFQYTKDFQPFTSLNHVYPPYKQRFSRKYTDV